MAVDPPYRIPNMMPGMIMIWYGSVETIPSGWHLCDGTMNTPDLRYRVVNGAAYTAHVGNIGGYNNHDHDFTGDGHQHNIPPGAEIAAGPDFYANTDSQPAVGTTDEESSWPPYRILCFIMKL